MSFHLFHRWEPVWHEGWSSLFHRVGYECAVEGCKARKEEWPSWQDGHECEPIEQQIAEREARLAASKEQRP